MRTSSVNSSTLGLNRLAGSAYAVTIAGYWALLYTASLTEDVVRGSLLYFLYIGPILLFVSIFSMLLLLSRRLTLPLAILLCYATVVSAVAIIRADFPTISSTLILTAVLVVIAGAQLAPRPQLLNWLFLASIPGGLIAHLLGYSIYGIVPGLSLDEELWWRISLFPVVAESAFFSAVILLLNLVCRTLPLRKTCIILAVYFLVFSGLRSALIGTVMALVLLTALNRSWMRSPSAVMVWLFGACLVFVTFLLLIDLLTVVPAFRSEFLNSYIFRAEDSPSSTEELTKSIYRTWLWSEHMRIAASNPLFGIGTFDFASLSDNDLQFTVGTGSESFLTGLYARVGLPALALLGFFSVTIWRQVKRGSVLPVLLALVLFVAMLAYGSFLVPYNFVFLVLIGLICGTPVDSRVLQNVFERSRTSRSAIVRRGAI